MSTGSIIVVGERARRRVIDDLGIGPGRAVVGKGRGAELRQRQAGKDRVIQVDRVIRRSEIRDGSHEVRDLPN